jgi:hypothetical protein
VAGDDDFLDDEEFDPEDAERSIAEFIAGTDAHATMLLLSRQHWEAMHDDTLLQWRLSAASTLVTGFIRPGQG